MPTPRAPRPCRAASTMSPSTRPVRRPSATSRRFARQKSRPRRWASGSRSSWNPPETTPTRPPAACTPSMSSCTPGGRRHPGARLLEDGLVESRQRRHAFAEARCEVELAAHRPLGDLGHEGEAARGIRQQLDGLLADEGRIGVEHDEGAARAARCRAGHALARTREPLPTTVMPLSVTMNPRARSSPGRRRCERRPRRRPPCRGWRAAPSRRRRCALGRRGSSRPRARPSRRSPTGRARCAPRARPR